MAPFFCLKWAVQFDSSETSEDSVITRSNSSKAMLGVQSGVYPKTD